MHEGEEHLRYPTDHPYILPQNRFEEAVMRSIENRVRLDDAERRLDAINGQLARNAELLNKITVTLARILVIGPIVIVLANLLVALLVFMLTMEGGKL